MKKYDQTLIEFVQNMLELCINNYVCHSELPVVIQTLKNIFDTSGCLHQLSFLIDLTPWDHGCSRLTTKSTTI